MRKTHVNASNARSKEQREVLKRIAQADFCPFCGDYMRTEHPHPVRKVGKFWLLTKIRWPYENSSAHYMFIHREHISSLDELSDVAWRELRRVFTGFMKKKKIKGATLIMRTGDTAKTGGSVTHLHAQLVSGNGKKPVITRVG